MRLPIIMPNGRCSVCGSSTAHLDWCERISAHLTKVNRLEDRLCEVEDCERRHTARGMCRRHYDRWLYSRPMEAACLTTDRPTTSSSSGSSRKTGSAA